MSYQASAFPDRTRPHVQKQSPGDKALVFPLGPQGAAHPEPHWGHGLADAPPQLMSQNHGKVEKGAGAKAALQFKAKQSKSNEQATSIAFSRKTVNSSAE